MPPRVLALLFTTALCFSLAPKPAPAQDRAQLGVQADALLRSASTESLDALFQSVHGLMKSPTDSLQVCRALASDARGSADTWVALAQGLSDANRDALTGALAEVALSGWQGTPMPFDDAAARRQLVQAGVRAAMLNEGFSASALGSAATPDADADPAQREAQRCRSLGWLLDAVASQPRGERAAITRLLLRDGIASTLKSSAPAAPGG